MPEWIIDAGMAAALAALAWIIWRGLRAEEGRDAQRKASWADVDPDQDG